MKKLFSAEPRNFINSPFPMSRAGATGSAGSFQFNFAVQSLLKIKQVHSSASTEVNDFKV